MTKGENPPYPDYGLMVAKVQDSKTYPLAFEAGRKAAETEIVRLLYRAIESCKSDHKIELNEPLFEVFNAIRNQAIQSQAEKDREAISVISDCRNCRKRIDELEIKLNDREADLIEAEKRGARVLARELQCLLTDTILDSSASRVNKVYGFVQAKLKSLEER